MPDLARIQALVVERAPGQWKAILFFRIRDAGAARGFIRACMPAVPSAAEVLHSAPPVLHLSFGWRGLAMLADGHDGLRADEGAGLLEPFFVKPQPSHPQELGFIGGSAPEKWWEGSWTSAEIDLAIHGSFESEAQAQAEIGRLRALAETHGMSELTLSAFENGALNGYVSRDARLHFGYRDGITKPAVDWAGDGTQPVDFREILLGYPSDDYPVSPFADGQWKELVRDGSFACIAWIEQHVAEFNRWLSEQSAGLGELAPNGDAEEWLAARLMGRWRDGSPVSTWPDAAPGQPDLNDSFGFADDPEGARCPLNAHIRIANMRDDEMTFANRIRFPKGPPRFERRGFSYGPRLDSAEDDGVSRGIVGTFFCARVNEQFYTVLRWLQETTFASGFAKPPHKKTMQDALFGARGKAGAHTTFRIGQGEEVRELPLRDFISYRGVVPLFMPSLPTLELLSSRPR